MGRYKIARRQRSARRPSVPQRSLIKVWHGDALKGQSAATLETGKPVVAGPNRLTAYAFNQDNVKSKDANFLLDWRRRLKRGRTAWVIAVVSMNMQTRNTTDMQSRRTEFCGRIAPAADTSRSFRSR